MKTLKSFLLVAGLLLSSLTFYSCLDDDDFSLDKYILDIVSVKSNGGAPYFRADDGTTLWPAAGYYPEGLLKDGQRVFLNFTLLGDSSKGAVNFDYYIRVNDIDTVFTKSLSEDLGAKNDSVYGTNPVDVKRLYTGNGHLTLLFGADFGGSQKHFINLIQIKDDKNPYLLEFRHHAMNDPAISRLDKWVCFNLNQLAIQDSTPVKLTVRVHTFNGPKEYTLEYDPKNK